MALARVRDLKGGLKEQEQCVNLPLGSPNNPVIRLRALRVEDLVWSDCCFAFVCSMWDREADDIIHQSTLPSNGLRSLTSGVMLVQRDVCVFDYTV